MKTLVLCEGRRDVELVKQYYQLTDAEIPVTTFIGEQVEYSRLKNRESNAIRNFLEDRNPYRVLAKSENGKSALKRIFTKLARFFSGLDADVCLVIDLDGGGYEDLIKELDERVRNNFDGQELRISDPKLLDDSPAQVAVRAGISVDGSLRSDFDVLAFRHSLEEATNIGHDGRAQDEAEQLRRFVSDDSGSSPMHCVL